MSDEETTPTEKTPADGGAADADEGDALRVRLHAESAGLGTRSTLLHFSDTVDGGLDITKAHPGSLPQFITGRSTLLSNLFRDEVAARGARIAAERIAAKDVELRTARALDTVHLAVGIASWRFGDREFTAPVLLRPLVIRRHHADFELRLGGSFEINPELAHAVREQFGIEIDGPALAALADDGGVFKPQPVIDSLRALTAHVPTFTVRPRLVVSTFADVSAAMLRDTAENEPAMLGALAGRRADRDTLTTVAALPETVSTDERPPAADRLLLDADGEQEAVLARIVAGHSLAVHTLPGTGGTQTVINAVGELVRTGRRVLVVSARRATLDGVRHRLAGIGLPALAVSPRTLKRDLVRAISRNEKAALPKVAEVDDALVRLRAVLRDYRDALTHRHGPFGISPLEALRTLTTIAQTAPQPSATTRFDAATLQSLATRRSSAATALTAAARLGEFRFGPDDSPWYGVAFSSNAEAQAAHALAERLHDADVPGILENGYDLVAQTHMRPFSTVAELGEYIQLLQGIRSSLDRFSLTVFERPIDDFITAHAPGRSSMSGSERRRLRRLSREYVRPGMHVGDMHEALLQVRDQRDRWEALIEPGVLPEAPPGMGELAVAWQRANAGLADLDRILGRRVPLATLPIERLLRLLADLAAQSEVFDNLVERATLRDELAAMGLEPLLAELSTRHVPEQQVAAEFEFAWWQSALEAMLRSDRSLLGANTAIVDRLEGDFRVVDEAHQASAGPLLAAELATRWKVAIVDEADEAERLRQALRAGDVSAPQLLGDVRSLLRTLAPVWLASPYDVPQIADSFDAVIIADAGALCLAEAAPALRRARQVVVFGDPVTQKPTPFQLASGLPTGEEQGPAAFDEVSVFERLADLLPVMTLTQSYRAGGEDLVQLVNDAFYGGEIASLPWAGSYLGRGSLSVDYVEGGYGTPDPVTGAVESPESEVARVVTLVTEHALNRPTESLMVITASRRHAERVRAAVATAFAGRSDVAPFVGRDTAEPFAVLTLEESVAESRDRVIFSLGFGLTKHGRVLSDFGDLSTPDGDRLLTVGMTRARRSMVIVSSIRPSAFDEGRLEHGAATVMSILGGIAARGREHRLEDLADPLTRTLAQHLRRLGAAVDVDYRGLLPLVAQHRGTAVVVESDPETRSGSLRESLRLRPQILRRLGWHYVRVHSFDLYSDPAGVAAGIAAILGIDADAPPAADATQPLDVG
nr:AAA family ATPase [Microbacterium sp. No. 7]